jgi:DNA-nicking Smr family endonuclease
MEFGKILDQWDKYSGPVYNKDEELAVHHESPASRRRRLHRKAPDASIDLHGFTQEQALDALNTFFTESKNNGLEKVLVIHGKGNHSLTEGQEPILKKTVRNFIERCPYAGENGDGSGNMGGSGSTWVLLKNLGKTAEY